MTRLPRARCRSPLQTLLISVRADYLLFKKPFLADYFPLLIDAFATCSPMCWRASCSTPKSSLNPE